MDEPVSDETTCPACGSPTTAEARFCPSCGARLEADETVIAYAAPERRTFGVVPPVAALAVAAIFLVAGLAALATGSWILGVSLLVLAAVLFVVFDEAARRAPETAVTRAVLASEDRVRDGVRLAVQSARAWTRAGSRVLRLRRRARALRRDRRERVLALGEAAVREDEDAVAALRARVRELDERIADAEREEAETLARARGRVAAEKLAVQPTSVIPPGVEEAADGTGATQERDAGAARRKAS